MPDHTDTPPVHLRKVRQHVGAVGRHVGEKRQGLPPFPSWIGQPCVSTGRPDRQGDKAALRKSSGVVAVFLVTEPDAGFGIIERHEHGRMRTLRLGQQKPALLETALGDLNPDAFARVTRLVTLAQHLAARTRQHLRPRPERIHPHGAKLRPPAFPVLRGANLSTVLEPQEVAQRMLQSRMVLGRRQVGGNPCELRGNRRPGAGEGQ